MTKSNTNRFVGAAWSLLTFQFVASAGAVAVTAWAVLEVQPRLARLQAMEQNEPAPAATEASDAAIHEPSSSPPPGPPAEAPAAAPAATDAATTPPATAPTNPAAAPADPTAPAAAPAEPPPPPPPIFQ